MKFNHIGLYFGSFNPIHEGHIYVVETALKTAIDKLYLVVSPQSPFKSLSELAPFKHRLEMARLSIKEHNLEDRVEVVDWEEHLFPSYTAKTLKGSIKELQENRTTIFMGLDNFLTIDRWKESKFILENYGIYVIPRGSKGFLDDMANKIKELKNTVTSKLKSVSYSNPFEDVNIAATNIRERILSKQPIEGLACDSVIEYIKKHKLYGYMEEATITLELAQWLQKEWRFNNHPKYQHYFKEWLNNITQSQADGFLIQKKRQENNIFAHLKPKTKKNHEGVQETVHAEQT